MKNAEGKDMMVLLGKYANWACPCCGTLRQLTPSMLKRYTEEKIVCRRCLYMKNDLIKRMDKGGG